MISYRDGRCIASSKDYLGAILEHFSELDDITYRAMMGEYILYYRGKVFGGGDDDCFLVKPTKATKAVMPAANLECHCMIQTP